MLGASTNGTPLLATPPMITTTGPVVAPEGTTTVMLVALQLVAVPAETPLNVTLLIPCDAPKFEPAMVTEVPIGPLLGVRLEMIGGGGVTVNATPLLATPPTVTITAPVDALAGTIAVMLEALQLLAVPAETPLNVTVLVPCDVPKFDPAIVTWLPTGPEVGFRFEILGGKTPLAALNAARPAPQLSAAASVAVAETPPATA